MSTSDITGSAISSKYFSRVGPTAFAELPNFQIYRITCRDIDSGVSWWDTLYIF